MDNLLQSFLVLASGVCLGFASSRTNLEGELRISKMSLLWALFASNTYGYMASATLGVRLGAQGKYTAADRLREFAEVSHLSFILMCLGLAIAGGIAAILKRRGERFNEKRHQMLRVGCAFGLLFLVLITFGTPTNPADY